LFAVVDMTIFDCLAGGALGTDDHRCSASRYGFTYPSLHL
jgi:hypothetical protein